MQRGLISICWSTDANDLIVNLNDVQVWEISIFLAGLSIRRAEMGLRQESADLFSVPYHRGSRVPGAEGGVGYSRHSPFL